jgi:hypothetical protein
MKKLQSLLGRVHVSSLLFNLVSYILDAVYLQAKIAAQNNEKLMGPFTAK